MGLLSKLADPPSEKKSPAEISPVEVSTTWTQCPKCGDRRGWIDRYGNPPHCATCTKPPLMSLVAEIIGEWPAETLEALGRGTKSDFRKDRARTAPGRPDDAASTTTPAKANENFAAVRYELDEHARPPRWREVIWFDEAAMRSHEKMRESRNGKFISCYA